MTAQARLLSGRYQVGELLGYGGMAEVHRGRDLRLGRDVAIKTLRTDLARDATFQMRFRREAQNAASLNHPAIVAVYDTGEEIAPTGETIPFIVMEYVNGRTLKEVLAAEGRLMPRRALEICADICAALEFSHRHGIIHRDIKPGNVMLTLTGQVKVMDFGIARALASGATTMTQTSAVIGTAQYLSPEQARGEAVDARSDVYAAGCVLFELLCGHPPFVGDSPVSVAYQHVREEPPRPGDINPDVTPSIDAIVLKALSKNPLNRYQSAAEMRADMLRAAAGRPVLATPVLSADETVAMGPTAAQPVSGGGASAPARVGAPSRRRPLLIATLSALGVLAVVALVTGLVMAANQPKKPTLVSVPELKGKLLSAAELEVRNLKLTPTPDPVEKPGCELNQVLEQNPAVGTRLEVGKPVKLTYCAGQGTTRVPEIMNLPKDEAKKLLDEAHLEAVFETADSKAPKDTVVEVSLKAGKTVPVDSKVIVKISLNNMADVPDVVDGPEEWATRILKQAGFKVVPVYEETDGTPGMVLDQSPKGTQKKGAPITITVSKAKENPTEDPPPTDQSPPPDDGGGGNDG
ncbi:MAG TPA: Stk1 family PASTA domain-containing Ser/Thr kinase [Micromonosporaceae bacterium]|nr:Stk1 family PASTA domain-containing Ser/Thr kinase [Micromonosporaceae bacterium]